MHTDHPSDEPFVLNTAERHAIYRIKGATMLVSSALGVFGIWVFYLPHSLWGDWFAETHTALGDWPLISILFAVLVLYLVIHALLLVHTGAIRLIEMTCQFPRFHDSSFARHLNQLAENSPPRSLFRLRMSPRPLLHWTMPGYLMTVLLLAFVANGVLQLLLRSWSERAVSPIVIVLTSTLVVAIGISRATYQILQQAQIRVMAPLTIRQFTNELVEEFGRETTFRQLLPAVLHYAAVSSRPDNYPHLLLREAVMARFSIDPEAGTRVKAEDVPGQLADCSVSVRRGLERLFIFTILLDGHLAPLERSRFRQLQNAGLLTISETDLESIRRNFVRGEGLWV
ncbi:hypothetical protein GCM10028803_34300 [Larkinella knui]